jgi:hypothetical protein
MPSGGLPHRTDLQRANERDCRAVMPRIETWCIRNNAHLLRVQGWLLLIYFDDVTLQNHQ